MTNKEACRRCGHRADYHHQMAPHPCGACDCAGIDIPLLDKPREVAVGVTPDKFVLPVFVAGLKPVICFGCGEHIEPGKAFIKRRHAPKDGEGGHYSSYARLSKTAVPFCPVCMPWSIEGVKS